MKTVLEEGPIFVYVTTPQGSVDVGVLLSNFGTPDNGFLKNASMIRMDNSDEIKLTLRKCSSLYIESQPADTLTLQSVTVLPITSSQQQGSVPNATRLEPNCEEKQGVFSALSSTTELSGQPTTSQSVSYIKSKISELLVHL